MAFRKRNVAIGRSPSSGVPSSSPTSPSSVSGVRPSPLTSIPVTSTGAASLDGLLGGHAGLASGASLLIEESGNTDFAGVLLRYYAAEGLCHGHTVHVVGVGEGWVRDLPATVDEKHRSGSPRKSTMGEEEKMKIAWRYERLGQVGERAQPNRETAPTTPDAAPQEPFCHTFDLTKKITLPSGAKVNHIPISPSPSPFTSIIQSITRSIEVSPPGSVHRLVVPSVLSPALYAPNASRPEAFLEFLRSLRALLRAHSTRLTALLTLPLELYPRHTALIRWAEILSDGVIEFTPFPHLTDASESGELARSGGAKDAEEQPQGLVKVHKLPINTERGEGGAGVGNSIGEDLAFVVSRRKFVIKPFSLPPVEGDQEAQAEAGKLTSKDIEF